MKSVTKQTPDNPNVTREQGSNILNKKSSTTERNIKLLQKSFGLYNVKLGSYASGEGFCVSNHDYLVNDSALSVLEKITPIKALHLFYGSGHHYGDEGRREGITDKSITTIENLKDLQVLTLHSTGVTASSLNRILQLPQLRTLVLSHMEITTESLSSFKHGNLEELLITLPSDLDLKYLSQQKSLKKLDLRLRSYSGHGLWELSELPALREINISLPADTAFCDIQGLAAAEWLTVLSMDSYNIGSCDLSALGKLKSLRELYLEVSGFSNTQMPALENLKSLEVLDLRGTKITGSSLSYISKLPQLQYLCLGENHIIGDQLVNLGSIKSLKWFDLHSTEITDASLASIDKFSSLEWLNLISTKITPKGLAVLKKCENLEYLAIDSSILNSLDDVESILKLPTLRRLYVAGDFESESEVQSRERLRNILAKQAPQVELLEYQDYTANKEWSPIRIKCGS